MISNGKRARTCVDPPVLPLTVAGGTSTDLAGSRRVRCGFRTRTNESEVLVLMTNGLWRHVQAFRWCSKRGHGRNACRRDTGRHSLGVPQIAAVTAIVVARNAHFGRYIYHHEVHGTGLNYRQPYPHRHQDGKQ